MWAVRDGDGEGAGQRGQVGIKRKKKIGTHLLLLVVELLLALSGVEAGTRLFSWSLSLLLYKGRAVVGPGLLMSAGVVDWEGEGAAGGLGVDEVGDRSSITAGATNI